MLELLLMGGVPNWVRNAYPLATPSLAAHFDEGRYWAAGIGQCSPDALFACTRASTKYAANAAGILVPIAVNALPIGTGNGLLVEQAATNLALQSQTFDNASWLKQSGGAGASPTVTADQGSAPDGTTTADRGQFNLNGGTTSADISQLRQTITVANTTAYIFSVYLKSNTASTYAMQIDERNTAATTNISVTPTWQRFSVTFTTASTSASVDVFLRGAQSPTNSQTADILMWGGQLELGTFPTSYIPTTTTSAARAADNIVMAGAALTAFQRPAITIVQKLGPTEMGSNPSGRFISFNASEADFIRPTGNNTFDTANITSQTLGSSNFQSNSGLAWSMDASGQASVGNLGTVSTTATAGVAITLVQVGNRSGLDRAYSGLFRRIAVIPSKYTGTPLQALSAP